MLISQILVNVFRYLMEGKKKKKEVVKVNLF